MYSSKNPVEKYDKPKTLFQCVREGDIINMWRILGDNSLDIEAKSIFGTSPLHKAVINGDIQSIINFLHWGNNVNELRYDLKTPLHYAVIYGRMDIIIFLLDNGAFINALDIYGWSPLHFATQNSLIHIVNLLLKRGALANIYNRDGKRPIDIAIENQYR
jgi:ankyrin repeat protein